MGFLKDLRKYLNWRSRIPTVPMQYIAPYKPSEVTGEAQLLMKAGLARSPLEAQKLIQKRGQSAGEIISNIPKKRINRKERILNLILRLQNAKPSHRIKPPKHDSKISLRARYREPKS